MESKVEEVKVIKKGSKKKKWILGSLVTLIVLGIFGVTMANTVVAKLAPDKYILLSMLNMKKLADKEENMIDLIYPDNRKTSLALNVKEIDGLDDSYVKDMIEGSGVSLSVANSAAGDILIDTGFKKDGTSLMDISVYSSKDQIGIKIPGLLDQYVMIDLKQFKQKYDASDLSYYMGDIQQDDVDLATDLIKQGRNAVNGHIVGVNSAFSDDLEELLMDLGKSTKAKHTGTAKVRINNKNKSADQFSILIDSADVKSFVKGITKSTLKHTDLLNVFLTLQNYYTKADLEEMISDALDEIKFSDVELTCAIDNKLRIVNVDITTAITINDRKTKIKYDYTLSGGESIFDTAEVNYSFSNDYDKGSIALERERTYSDRKTKVSDDIVFKVRDSSDQIFRATFNTEQDLKATVDNFALNSNIIIDEDSKLNLKLSGDLFKSKEDGEYSLDANKIDFKYEEFDEVFSIRGSGAFKVANLNDQSIAISDTQQLDLFSIGAGELINIATRIGSQFYDMNNFLNYLF